MPLRDHFRPPVETRHSWDELHGMWPAVIVQKLFAHLPDEYVAAPGVRLGAMFEIDVSADEQDEPVAAPMSGLSGGVAVAPLAPPQPTLTIETELPDQDEYEVRIYDDRHGRRLVAAIELISPGNKDRPESRRAFVGKVAALLQRNVCVSLVDVVTIRDFNLYADVLEFIGGNDPSLQSKPPGLYAVTLRGRKRPRQRSLLESWFYPMQIGQPLPTLPIWLDVDLSIDLELESSYEETCRFLRIS
ncbi:MAG: DUF4058 family protein [Isosphaeraceae bacterium]|nr:DUF4058 family protein [Isosphaeraceae bacterium]